MRKPRCFYLLVALGFVGLISGTINFSSAQPSLRYTSRGQVQPPDDLTLAQMQQARITQRVPATTLVLPRPARDGLNLHDYLTRYVPEQLTQPRASFTVNNFFDDAFSIDLLPGDGICADVLGGCGLRTAIMETNALPGLDTIILGAGTWTLGRPGVNENFAVTGDLDITNSLIIQGAGVGQTIINGGGVDRVFQVFAGADFYDLSVTGGDVSTFSRGGGINIGCNGNLLIQRVGVYGNKALNGGGISVGECNEFEVLLNIYQSTIYQNKAIQNGGGIDIYQHTSVILINSTISQNESGNYGSGVYVEHVESSFIAQFMTLAENYSASANGAGFQGYTGTANHSIFAYNTATEAHILADCIYINPTNPRFSEYFNVYTSAGCRDFGGDGILDPELALGELALNAPGTTMTHALLPGASAIDFGVLPCDPTEDQRGAVRPQGPGCDSGAYEAEFIAPTATNTATATATSTVTHTATATSTFTPSSTYTPTATFTASNTPTITKTPSATLTQVETATATFTPTVTFTVTEVTVTSTPTETDEPAVQLNVNGGFEADNIAPWIQKNASKDKRKCNQPDKIIAHSGDCVYLFNSSPQENSKIVQKPDLTGLNFATGDTLDFSLFVNANKASATGKIKLRVVYSDGTPTGKRNAIIESTDGYIEISDAYTMESAAVSLIKIQIQNQSKTGKVYIDDVSLIFKAGDGSVLLNLPAN